MASLADMTNDVLFALGEPGANPGGLPNIPAGATYSQALITAKLNQGINEALKRSGYAPAVAEKRVSLAIVAGLDYALPADCVTLIRVEYQQGANGIPIPLNAQSFAEFDAVTGDNAALGAVGAPYIYREPFASSIRFNPQPGAQQVANGDKIILYYTSYGITLAAMADVPNLPIEFHDAPVSYALARLFPRKQDASMAKYYMDDFNAQAKMLKARYWNVNQDRDFVIADAEFGDENTLYDD